MLCQIVQGHTEVVFGNDRVRIEKEHEFPRGFLQCQVIGPPKSEVGGGGDPVHFGELRPDPFFGPVARGVVDYDYFYFLSYRRCAHRPQALV